MPSPLPDGDIPPADGLLPASAGSGAGSRDFGLYIHVPFCRVRCGYCDFNTYTATELDGVSRARYPDAAIAEMTFAALVLSQSGVPKRNLSTVFLGGGTPTLLGPTPLVQMLQHSQETFGWADDVEITVEANPDGVSAEDLRMLAEGGVTRVSVGMQSADRDVLATLDRTHNPDAVPQVVEWVLAAGMQVSLDLIYGAPGETLSSWEKTLSQALALEPDHLSAYSLIVEPGTALAAKVARGELVMPDDDIQADMYTVADELLEGAGYHWYEVSNWAKDARNYSRHNMAYWTSQDWWGIGPGGHSHVGGVRWWNVKHPSAYTTRIQHGVSPAAAREVLDETALQLERVALGIRTAAGIAVSDVAKEQQPLLAHWVAEGLVEGAPLQKGLVVATQRGRLMADFLARELT